MALSGDKTWTLTRDDIINAALRKVGEYDSNETADTNELTDAGLALNAMVKEWSADGVGFWLNQRTVLILNSGTQWYTLGPSGTSGTTDNFHAFPDRELVETVLTVANTGVVQLGLEDDDWVDFNGQSATKPGAVTYSIGVRLDSGGIHWANYASSGVDTIDLDVALPSAAAVGNKVYAYLTANRTERPTGIIKAYRRDTSNVDTPVQILTRQEYESQSLKSASGPPTGICYAPLYATAAGNLNAELYVWPASNPSTLDKIVMITTFYADDFDAGTNDMEFPPEWGNALIWCLADELAEEYELDHDKALRIAARAEKKREALFTNAVEDSEVTFGVESR